MTRDALATRPVRPSTTGQGALDLPRLTAATARAVAADGAFGYQLLRFEDRVHFGAVHARGDRRFCEATTALEGMAVEDYACAVGQPDPAADTRRLYRLDRWTRVGRRLVERLGAWAAHWRPAGICSTLGMTIAAGSILLGGVVVVRGGAAAPFAARDIAKLDRAGLRRDGHASPVRTTPRSEPESAAASTLAFDATGALFSASTHRVACPPAVLDALGAAARQLAASDRVEGTVVAGGLQYRLERLERLDTHAPLVIARPTAGRPVVLGPRALLTPAQLQIAELVVLGATNDEIARSLGRSPHTVHHHIKAIYACLGIGSRVELSRQLLG